MGKFYIRFAIGIGQYPVLIVGILAKFHIYTALQWCRNRSGCSGYTFQLCINIHSPCFKVLQLSSLLNATLPENNKEVEFGMYETW